MAVQMFAPSPLAMEILKNAFFNERGKVKSGGVVPIRLC